MCTQDLENKVAEARIFVEVNSQKFVEENKNEINCYRISTVMGLNKTFEFYI